jgi:hypothetical protein
MKSTSANLPTARIFRNAFYSGDKRDVQTRARNIFASGSSSTPAAERKHATAHTTQRARESTAGHMTLRAVDQPVVTEEIPSAIPLMALSTASGRSRRWPLRTSWISLATLRAATAPRSELAQAFGLHSRPAEMLLTGCAALGLLEKSNGRYRNTPLSETYLVRGKPYYFGGFVQMADQRLYAGLGKLIEALRTNRPTTWDPAAQSSTFEGEDPTMLATFWETMHSLST